MKYAFLLLSICKYLFSTLIVIVNFLIISPVMANDEISTAGVPEWVETVNVPKIASGDVSNGSSGTIFLLTDKQVNLLEGRHQRYSHFAQKIRNESGLEKASQITIDFDPTYHSLTLHFVRVIRKNEVIDKLNSASVSILQRETDLENSVFDGWKTATLILEDIRIGDVVEYSYSLGGGNPAFGGRLFGVFDLQWEVPVNYVFYKIIAGNDAVLNFKPHLTNKTFAQKLVDGNWHYYYNEHNVPALHADDKIPSWYNPYPWIQVSQFSEWQDVVEWALPFYKIPKQTPENILYSAMNIGANAKFPEDRIRKALKFVQDDIRYTGIQMGISSYKPNPPDVVLNRRFGDCKDKVVLLMSILESFGLEAYPVLVHTRLGKTLSSLLPTPTAFNHVILLVKFNGLDYWLDPTINAQFGTLKNIYQPDYGYGLIVRKGESALTQIGPKPSARLQKEVFETFQVNYDKEPTVFSVKTIYYGNSADNIRHYFNNNELKKINKEYLNYFAQYYSSIESLNPLKVEDDREKNTFTVFEKYEIPKFWEINEDEKRFVADFFQPDLNNLLEEPKYTRRSMPLAVNSEREVRVHTEIKLKDKWPIKSEKESVTDNAFLFERNISPSGNDFSIDYRYQSIASTILPDKVDSYANNVAKARDLIGYSIYTTELNGRNLSDMPGNKVSTPNWPIIIVFSMALLISLFVCYKLFSYDPVPTASYVMSEMAGIKGWLVFPAIGLVLGPFRYLRESKDFFSYFEIAQWNVLTLPSSEFYHHLWAPVIIGEMVLTTFMFCFLLLLGVLFFKKRSSLPRLYVAFLLASILVAAFDQFVATQIPQIADQTKSSEYLRFIISSLITFAWIMYFLTSRRVASTFTVRKHVPADAQNAAITSADATV